MNENHVVNNNYIFFDTSLFSCFISSQLVMSTKIRENASFFFLTIFNMIKFTPVLIINLKEKHLERKK